MLHAQTELGTIAGTVTDPKGSAVPNAEVVVTHVATAITNKATTNGSGEFVVPNLVPGEYAVSVSAPGFKTTEQKGGPTTRSGVVSPFPSRSKSARWPSTWR